MRQMSALVKPASGACNLNCKYCFYCDEMRVRSKNSSGIMSRATAENAISKIFDFCGADSEITFMFQGGEPTLAGLDFFKDFVAFAEKKCPDNTVIHYSLQTNGIAVDGEWCSFFKEHSFLVGVSLDGTRDIHNRYRCFRSGEGSFEQVMAAVSLLREYSVDFNILTVITGDTAAKPKELFDFYIENDFRFVQPIFCLDPLDGTRSSFSLTARAYARFQKRFFNLWLAENKAGRPFYVSTFNNLLSLLSTGKAEQCGISGQCNAQLVIEADGTVYPCDFYCIDEFECPNINTSSITDIVTSDSLQGFLRTNGGFNPLCGTCEALKICRGGCKRYRPLYNGENGYCPQRDFLLHAASKLKGDLI